MPSRPSSNRQDQIVYTTISFSLTVLLLLLSSPAAKSAEPVTLAWDPLPDPSISGYRLYYGTSSGAYEHSLDAGNGTTAVLSDLADATRYYAAVTAYNAFGESGFSDEIAFETVPPQSLPGSATLIMLEAESGQVTSPMEILSDAEASSAFFITATETASSGNLTLQFEAPSEEIYYAWCRVRAPSGADDSFFVSLNGGPELIYHIHGSASPEGEPWTDEWVWTRILGADGSPVGFDITAGLQSLVFSKRESGTDLDRIIITSNQEFVPSDSIPVSGDYVAFTSTAQNQLIPVGHSTSLKASIVSTGPVGYQWYKDGVAIPGATGSSLEILNYQSSASGSYSVTVTSGSYSTTQTFKLQQQPGLQISPVGGVGEDKRIQIDVSGEVGQSVTIEHSSDLFQWSPLNTILIENQTHSVLDPATIGEVGRRFYRATTNLPE